MLISSGKSSTVISELEQLQIIDLQVVEYVDSSYIFPFMINSPPSPLYYVTYLYTHLHILIFLYSPPTPSLLRKEGAIHTYAEHYESILRNKSVFIFYYIVLRSETKNHLKGSDSMIISDPLSRDLPSLRSREGMGVSLYETKEIPDRKDVYKG